ncbi:MAG: 5-(carboxyamino)imidazole ribonucleotide mutase [Planctomycetes bacterium]|nr:5-(carboxyamino)imidazole ribonucleotide mutase [Planctomycetota bacterium]
MADNKVLILMGSDSDFPVMKKAVGVLKEFGVECEVRVHSVHRVPEVALKKAAEAESEGFRVIICGAGMAAHLAGAVAAKSNLPVIGVPLESGALKGVDALYSTVQMPPGVPVATVGIGGSKNAAILAVRIMALSDSGLRERLDDYRRSMADEVLAKDRRIQEEL